MDFLVIYVCNLKYGRDSWEVLFVCLFVFYSMLLNKTEKLKAELWVAAAVMSFKDLRGKEK